MVKGVEGWNTRPSYEVQLLVEQVRQMSGLIDVIQNLQGALDQPISPRESLHHMSLIDLARLADRLEGQAVARMANSLPSMETR
jgi:hypothetical protein